MQGSVFEFLQVGMSMYRAEVCKVPVSFAEVKTSASTGDSSYRVETLLREVKRSKKIK